MAVAKLCCMRAVGGIKPEHMPLGIGSPRKTPVNSRMRLENSASSPLLSTDEAAKRLGFKRQQFQVLVRFLGLRPAVRRRVAASRTPVNLYGVAAIESLARIGQRCRNEGADRILESLASEPGLR